MLHSDSKTSDLPSLPSDAFLMLNKKEKGYKYINCNVKGRVHRWSCWLHAELDAPPSCDLHEVELHLQPVAPESCGIQFWSTLAIMLSFEIITVQKTCL